MANKTLYDDRSRNAARAASNGKTACVDVGRVFDSCCDRDCVEELRVYFSACDQQAIEAASAVRAKSAKVVGMNIDVDELPFQDGYYTCKLTFYIEVKLELCDGCGERSCVKGCAAFEKKVVLYGGEGTVQVFSGDMCDNACDRCYLSSNNAPHCTVQVAEPVLLDVRTEDVCNCRCSACCCSCDSIPDQIVARIGGDLRDHVGNRAVVVTIGLFSIVQLVRNTQMLIPVYDYCIPYKECRCDEETPCDLFNRMSFPVEEFFPPICKNSK